MRPVWTPDDGITYSLLSRFIVCRQRFWIRAVLGLVPKPEWNHRIEYGSMFHAGLEAISAGTSVENAVGEYANSLLNQFPQFSDDIHLWSTICKGQLEVYSSWWKDDPKSYLLHEEVFDVPVGLPSGRSIRLRGKVDSVFSRQKSVYLQENKIKGDIDLDGIMQQMAGDLQTMMYITALDLMKTHGKVRRVLYNVIQRPLGGKYPLRKRKAETPGAFAKRVVQNIRDSPESYFHRIEVEVTDKDVLTFRQRCLYPLLEGVLDWWESIKDDPTNPWVSNGKSNKHHWIRPFGVYDSLGLGFRGDYYDFIVHGSMNGLQKTTDVFPELKQE
ncbi:MAG: PD-(D/E)XK nuclease family protein [Candidatus Bilamarchaeaceae archaeon]